MRRLRREKAGPAKFVGINVRPSFTNMTEASFKLIKPGQTIENTIDIATVYDITETGDYTVLASGAMPYAAPASTALGTGNAVYFQSNSLILSVNGAEAAQVPKAIPPSKLKRTNIASDCTGSRLTVLKDALTNCAFMSKLAAQAADTNDAESNERFVQYFKTNHRDDHIFVANRFNAVAKDCASHTGTTVSHCRDAFGFCIDKATGASANAYAFSAGPDVNNIVYCDPYFNYEPAIAHKCHEYDQGTTALHEETHCPAVLNPINQDYAYQYAASSKLNAYESLHNADSYNLYANGEPLDSHFVLYLLTCALAVYLNCPIQSP